MKPEQMINKNRLLLLLAAFPPLSTDMYLPAIPLLQQSWQQPLSIVNLTLADNVVSLIAFRVLQAAGVASASALSLAISKDVYDVHERERILAYIGVIIFIYFMLGAFAMGLISMDWADKVRTIGILGTMAGGILLGIWLLLPGMAGAKK